MKAAALVYSPPWARQSRVRSEARTPYPSCTDATANRQNYVLNEGMMPGSQKQRPKAYSGLLQARGSANGCQSSESGREDISDCKARGPLSAKSFWLDVDGFGR